MQDSRILSEIHIAILKCIIKDIEDVARTPITGLGSNQYTATIPGGGHPQIVEGVSNFPLILTAALLLVYLSTIEMCLKLTISSLCSGTFLGI